VARAVVGDTFTIMGVPVGSGRRVGIERRLDGTLDGNAPAPQLHVARSGSSAMVAWNTNAAFVLETATAIPPTNGWVTETSVRGIVGGEYNVTNSLATNRFFRLKQL
jgi:hypothetical protein